MAPDSRYYRRFHLSEAEARPLARLFEFGLTATVAAALTGIMCESVTPI